MKKLKMIFSDRGSKAGDSGEAMYRWVRLNHPEIQIRYLLFKDSCDWSRLQKDDFNLVDLSDSATLAREFKDATHHVFPYNEIQGWAKLPNRDHVIKVFISHGNFFGKSDHVKRHFNKGGFDMMIAGTRLEYDGLTHNDAWYGKDFKNYVHLCGMPRWDSLVKAQERVHEENNILIQWWWRPLTKNNEEAFLQSDFYKNVNNLFKDSRWATISEKYHVNFIWKMHVMMEKYQNKFYKNPAIKVIPNEKPFEPLFLSSKMIITDFTSNVWEMGVIGKPCLYFEPDWEDLKRGRMTEVPNFPNINIGPFTYNPDEFFKKLEEIIKNNYVLDKVFLDRRKYQIPFMFSKSSCERTFNAIMTIPLKSKVVKNKQTYSSTFLGGGGYFGL